MAGKSSVTPSPTTPNDFTFIVVGKLLLTLFPMVDALKGPTCSDLGTPTLKLLQYIF